MIPEPRDDAIAALKIVLGREQGLKRKLRKTRDGYNFLVKRLPGKGRIYELDRLADELEMEADFRSEQVIIERDDENKISLEMSVDTSRMRDDATFLRRLAYDLGEMRDFARGNPRKGTEKWPFEMEERP
jgi:hypothetical protein